VLVIKSRRIRWAGHVARVWGRGEMCAGFWWGNLRERGRWRDPGEDEKIILGWIFKKWDVSEDWIGLAQDRYRWRALVSAVRNLRVP
jgi:hypothetical protein